MDQPTRRLDQNYDPNVHPSQRPCYECGGHMVEAHYDTNQGNWLIRKGVMGAFEKDRSNIKPFVCMNCGSIREYAEKPGNLND